MDELHAAILAHLREQRAIGDDNAPPRGARVVIYARVTPQEVGGAALFAQLARCRAYARQEGYVMIAAYEDIHDGATLQRPRLAILRELLGRGEIGAVLVAGLDRLATDPIIVEGLRAEWAAARVALLVAGPLPAP